MKRDDNIFGKYSSKVKRVNIPIPSFEYVHKSWFSDKLGSPTPGFMIGRDRIIEKLKTWLIKEKTSGGSYLITGYRGMGKTSFVDRVLYELVGETNVWLNLAGVVLFIGIAVCLFMWISSNAQNNVSCIIHIGLFGLILHVLCKYYYLKEVFIKTKYRIQAGIKYIVVDKNITIWGMMKAVKTIWCGLTSKEWDRINHLIYEANEKDKRYSHITVSVNLGQEILDERNILCVLTSELYNKYKQYILSPIANVEMWTISVGVIVIPIATYVKFSECNSLELITWDNLITNWDALVIPIIAFFVVSYHQLSTLCSLKILRKRIDAELKSSQGIGLKYKKATLEGNMEFAYPIANIRDIESRIITILDRIYRYPVHPTFYFVFDELDKIETPLRKLDDGMPEFSNEKYLSSGGTSRKRKFMVMHLLANMKYFTTTAKAKFLFIAGREMYDGYLADLTDRESAISSLFNGIVYVESFCKNEKSEKDVMYNAETFIARQIIPRWYIEDRIQNRYIECKLNGKEYTNMDIDLKLYYEFLITVYTKNIMRQEIPHDKKNLLLKDARAGIDKAVGLLYHFTVYLYHVSNGSPKKMRLTFENLVRPIRDPKEFRLTKRWNKHYPLGGRTWIYTYLIGVSTCFHWGKRNSV
ncbi:ATP-binding protein [Phocaeicola vulgatus]|nr:ATP-binding protein [Phocaeicola vulgatus]